MYSGMSDRLRRLIVEGDGKCHLCGLDVVVVDDPHHPGFPTRDHIIPRCLVKSGTPGTFALAHKVCNNHRKHRHLSECVPGYFQQIYSKAVQTYEQINGPIV